MRKLLIASQKGGVGKTTTSMNLAAATALCGTRVLLLDADPLSNVSTALNLAEHPNRQALRKAGIDLPGALVINVVPGLDVYSPYDDGCCSDEEFDRVLSVLTTPPARRCYGCMIVDVPPFLGGNPAQLIQSCEEYLLVMRAEAMAYRTLPAFLELVQRSKREDQAIQMRGILLTLPEGEETGCRWERELRGRFGNRVLSQVIPHDEILAKALEFRHIGSHAHPDSPAAQQYRQLAEKLGLASETSSAVEAKEILDGLREAAALVGPASTPVKVSEPKPVERPVTEESRTEEVDLFAAKAEPLKSPVPPAPRIRRVNRPAEIQRPPRSERPLPPVAPSPAPARRKAAQEKSTTTPKAAPTVQANSSNALAQLWPLWILLGAIMGGGLRMVPATPSMLPILVGLGVALLVVVSLSAMAMNQERGASASSNKRGRTRTREAKKTNGRVEARKDPIMARLASLAAAPKKSSHDLDVN